MCHKGIADKENISVITMKNDLVTLVSTSEGEIVVEGVTGWCKGYELTFTPNKFVEHFSYHY